MNADKRGFILFYPRPKIFAVVIVFVEEYYKGGSPAALGVSAKGSAAALYR